VDAAAPQQLTTAELNPEGGSVGAHRDGAERRSAEMLFVPIDAGALREATRSGATRGRRAQGRLRDMITLRAAPSRLSRLAVARLLLAAVLAVVAVVIGPGLVRGAVRAGHSTSVPVASQPSVAPTGSLPAAADPSSQPSAVLSAP